MRPGHIVLSLTPKEAAALDLIVTNGWGDGEARDLLGDDVAAFRRARAKLTAAQRRGRVRPPAP